MTQVRVRGFQIFRDRHGRWRCYHRATRTPVDLTQAPLGSTEFFAECQRIAAIADKVGAPKPGTLGALIVRYRRHEAFTDLADRTRADYQRVFDYLQPIGDTALTWFTPPRIVRIRDRAGEQHGRRFGTMTKQVLSVLFGWGVERGYLPANPAFRVKGIRRPRNAPEANRPWGDDERHAVLEAAPPHVRLPIALMMFTGMDPQDAVRLPRSAVADGRIAIRRRKTGVPVPLPVPAWLAECIAAAPEHDAIPLCANSYGKPWTSGGFHASWRKVRLRLEADGKVQPGLTLKGLRHTVATILAEIGLDDRAIADVLGHRTLAMAQHHARRADRSRGIAGTIGKLDAEVNRRRTNPVKPGT